MFQSDTNGTFTRVWPYQIIPKRMMDLIGSWTKRCYLEYASEHTLPIIEAICKAKSKFIYTSLKVVFCNEVENSSSETFVLCFEFFSLEYINLFAFPGLQKFSFPNDAITSPVNTFAGILNHCSNSLQKVVVPAEYYFFRNPQIFHLRCLYFICETWNFSQYLNHPSCTAQELIIELGNDDGEFNDWEVNASPQDRWSTIISCFENAQK